MKYALIMLILGAALARNTPARQEPAKTSSNQTEGRSRLVGAITGRVIGAEGQPLAGVRVVAFRIAENDRRPHAAVSDDDGNFKLDGLSAGAHILFAAAPGYVYADISLGGFLHFIGENVIIGLVKGSVITGRVTDEVGEPLVGVAVRAHRIRDLEGKKAGSESFSRTAGLTDDRGIYRLFGLMSGVYLVSTDSSDGTYAINGVQIRKDAPTYYPSTTRAAAGEITLHAGEEVSAIDIRHRGDPGRTVSGRVDSGETVSSPPYQIVLVRLRGRESGGFESATSAVKSGGFVFYGVPDGEYELTASRGADEGEAGSSATRRIEVKGTDLNGVELKLAPQGAIAGRIVIASSSAPKGCAIDNAHQQTRRRQVIEEILLSADRDEPEQRKSQYFITRSLHAPNEKGEFVLKDLEGGRYRIVAYLPEGSWYLSSISAAGAAKSATEIGRNGIALKSGEKVSGVEVTIAEGAAALDGRVVPDKEGGKLPSSLRACLVPAEAESADDLMRYAEADVRSDGSFVLKNIAPGKYLIHARIAERGENDDELRPASWDAGARARLRREAAAAGNAIELQPCSRTKDYVLHWK